VAWFLRASLVFAVLASSQARWQVEPDASDFDRWVRAEWNPSVVPLLNRRDLTRVVDELKTLGDQWIEADGPELAQQRRQQVATFVLDFLLTQDVAYEWPAGSPARRLFEWASDLMRTGPPSEAERLWYLAGLGLLQRTGSSLGLHALYARQRFPDEPRFVLARALAEEQQFWPEARGTQPFSPVATVLFRVQARYQDAAALPAVAAEANIRLGHIELRRGRHAEALALFEAAGDPTEPWLRYLRYLFTGQAYERSGQLDAAEGAYSTAFTAVPYAQSATLAWASSLRQRGQIAEATTLTERLLALPSPVADPWLQYVPSEWRHFDTWMSELRERVRRGATR
jgi:tetratricopeptide (TPR) repeat protein